jgi:molybdopterin/thiamine biosynthesis adenylyltransferase
VLVIGAGGLGCGAALALAAAGVSLLTVVDDDTVDETNLHRQVLLSEESIGQPKVKALAETLARCFPGVKVQPERARFNRTNALELADACAVMVDGSDNLETKFLANDAAVLLNRPLVHAAAVGTAGQLMTVAAGGRPCYRCLFEEIPAAPAEAAPSCAEAGVLGPVPGVIGALQASEALRILRGETPAFSGRLIRYDSRLMTLGSIRFRPNPACRVCGTHPTIRSLEDSAEAASPKAENCTL